MKKVLHWLAHFLREMLPPLIFFLAVFHLISLTKALLLESYALTSTGVALATTAAVLAAKAIHIGEKLPFANLFSGVPLARVVLWKGGLFWLLCLLLRFLEEVIHLWLRHENLATATHQIASGVSWPLFWAMQIWLLLALLLYVAITELDRSLGDGIVRHLFLGGSSRPAATLPGADSSGPAPTHPA